jgi:ribosomal protein S18 acetylase RimI-like enzyme
VPVTTARVRLRYSLATQPWSVRRHFESSPLASGSSVSSVPSRRHPTTAASRDGCVRAFRRESVPATTARRAVVAAPEAVDGWRLRTAEGMLAAANRAGSVRSAIGCVRSVRCAVAGPPAPLPGRFVETIAARRPSAAVPGVRIRRLRPGEEPALLAALNLAWAGTWNFCPIEPAALARDVRGRRDGMFVAVPAIDEARIVATCHAIFDAAARNPDGGPSAWISNLMTDPAWRGRGLARMLLAAGVTYLRSRGAGSVALGVDGGNVAPFSLYRASGFEIVSTLDVWENHLEDNRR